MVAGLKSMDYETRLAVLDLFPLEYRRLRGDLILTYALFEQGLANRFFTVDPANTRRGHGERRPLNDKNKTDPGNLGESLDPVYQSVTEFMLCRYETHDPRACLKEGKLVTSCAQDFFRRVKKHCSEEFTRYFTCLHKYGGPSYSLERCRSTQYPFDACLKEHLNLDRPEPGYFNRVRLHKTDRPRPEPMLAPMPEQLPDLPNFADLPEPKRMKERRQINDWFL
ncbi:NADH dehydrogenase (ubiquinone) 1 alpha subcomplex 8 [Clonorchis sinensis]|uniref:NADH dehydrogenase (Ubiquinone) 1 alpha subcomplex 8 n=1 Tax=Clonorchis sinensis TaxID=79923 RepID=G7Y7E9_CLOSI|nr:NADH dehydrogenase (ubiquinone) 1 alpha subcomplex 8 [Clonorchis sinensis]